MTERALYNAWFIKYPLTVALLDLWNFPYSRRYAMFAARQMYHAMLRGCPSILD